MRLRNLRKLEEMEIRAERDALTAERDGLAALLADEARAVDAASPRSCARCARPSARTRRAARGAPASRMRPRSRSRLRGDDRARADHGGLLGDGLDPGDEGPPRRRRPSSSSRTATGRASCSTPRPPTGCCSFASNGRMYTLACADAARRARLGRAGAADGRPAERGADARAVRACAGRQAAGRLRGRRRLRAARGRGGGADPRRPAGPEPAGRACGRGVCRPLAGDHVAVVGDNRKLLVFPRRRAAGDGPGQGRAAAALQGRRARRRARASTSPTGSPGRTRPGAPAPSPSSPSGSGARAGAGRMAPRGFPREQPLRLTLPSGTGFASGVPSRGRRQAPLQARRRPRGRTRSTRGAGRSAPSDIRQTTATVLFEACIRIGISTLPPVWRKTQVITIEKQTTVIAPWQRGPQAMYSTPSSGRCQTDVDKPDDQGRRQRRHRLDEQPQQHEAAPARLLAEADPEQDEDEACREPGRPASGIGERLCPEQEVEADRRERQHTGPCEHDEVPDPADAPEHDAAERGP